MNKSPEDDDLENDDEENDDDNVESLISIINEEKKRTRSRNRSKNRSRSRSKKRAKSKGAREPRRAYTSRKRTKIDEVKSGDGGSSILGFRGGINKKIIMLLTLGEKLEQKYFF